MMRPAGAAAKRKPLSPSSLVEVSGHQPQVVATARGMGMRIVTRPAQEASYANDGSCESSPRSAWLIR
jgi:hypothetical protein